MRINIPTRLTLFRLLSIPPFLILMSMGDALSRYIATLIFIVAAITDYYDGKMARKLGVVTTLGKFLDPLADKLLIAAPFILFVQMREITVPAWMIVIIISREFIITGLRSIAASAGRVLPAQPAGKFKTTSQLVTIITILVFLSINSILEEYFGIPRGSMLHYGGPVGLVGWILFHGPYVLVAFTTVLTVTSGWIYLRDNMDIIVARPGKEK